MAGGDFQRADPSGATFDGADPRGTGLVGSCDLPDTQAAACAPADTPLLLPAHLEWTGRRCRGAP